MDFGWLNAKIGGSENGQWPTVISSTAIYSLHKFSHNDGLDVKLVNTSLQ